MRALFLALRGASAIAIAASVTPTPSFAQSEPAVSESDEILVQARRRGEDLQDVPLVVQAVTDEELNKLEIRRFEDIARLVPGLQLDANTTSPGTFASLRGVNFDSQASGASTTIEFYRNDAVISSSALFQAVYDVGQIEVLRGPQGTLRGRASPSGSITVATRRPELGADAVGVSGQATYDSSNRWNINGAVNAPLIPDMLGVRFAGFVGENEGNGVTGINIRTGAADKNIYDKTEAFRGSVRFVPIKDVLVLDFNQERINRRSRGYDQVESFSLVNTAAAPSPRLVLPEQR
ncbi:MAG: TonB-dependent receptor plug domain-containing protein, partial [Parvularculaceae bacterium]|nr:TonB-dependent receptor plug domain-containing protein [Parvularculaceae bacterium]